VKITNLRPESISVGWVVNQLGPTVRPVIPGLTASFFVKGTFRLRPGEAAGEWGDRPDFVTGDVGVGGDVSKGISYASDFVPYKPRADFAVSATAYAPPGGVTSFEAAAVVGDRAKRLVVYGTRNWEHSFLSEAPGSASSVERVPVDYTRAWGGAEHPLNPIGVGPETQELPNFEEPGFPIASPKQNAFPAGLLPFPADWPQRRSKVGTFDADWKTARWPWLPHDFNWSYFNAVPESQWMDGYLRGDEKLRFLNLHPEHGDYRSELPGVRARTFVTRKVAGERSFAEVSLDLDTLWVDLEAEKMILVWRGRTAVDSLKLRDVTNLLIDLEPLAAEPKRADEYRHLQVQALEPRLPQPPPAAGKASSPASLQAEIEGRVAEAMQHLSEAEQVAAKHEADFLGSVPNLQAQVREKGLEPPVPGGEIEQLSKLAAGLKDDPRMHPESASAISQHLSEVGGGHDGKDLFDAELSQTKSSVEKVLPDAFAPPEAQAAPPAAEPLSEDAIKSGVLEKGAGRGADFSGMDLSGARLAGAVLKGAKFVGTKLVAADLSKADLSGADLSGADLTSANLSGADFHDCVVSGAVFKNARIQFAKMPRLDLGACDFSGANGEMVDLRDANLAGANFSGADLPKANLRGAHLEKADFTRAKLRKADCSGAQARGVIMDDADLTAFRASRGADLSNGSFRRVMAAGSTWKGCIAEDANFSQALLVRAMMNESSFKRTTFDRSNLRQAQLVDADFEKALLTLANLMQAKLDRSNLTGASLNGSNLFECGLWESIFKQTTWHEANVQRTILDVT